MNNHSRLRAQTTTQSGDCIRERLKDMNPLGAKEPKSCARKLPDIGSDVDHCRGTYTLPSQVIDHAKGRSGKPHPRKSGTDRCRTLGEKEKAAGYAGYRQACGIKEAHSCTANRTKGLRRARI